MTAPNSGISNLGGAIDQVSHSRQRRHQRPRRPRRPRRQEILQGLAGHIPPVEIESVSLFPCYFSPQMLFLLTVSLSGCWHGSAIVDCRRCWPQEKLPGPGTSHCQLRCDGHWHLLWSQCRVGQHQHNSKYNIQVGGKHSNWGEGVEIFKGYIGGF